MVRPERLELPTLCSEGRCSIQLSYGRQGLFYGNPAGGAPPRDLVLKPAFILAALRGAEAPFFHVTAPIPRY